MTTEEMLREILTLQQTLLVKINAVLKAVAPREGSMGLVGEETNLPKAPTRAEIAADPGKYDGTPYDPIDRTHRVSSQLVIANFESPEKAGEFAGGTLRDWALIDFPAVWRYLIKQYPGLDVNRFSPSQRTYLGL